MFQANQVYIVSSYLKKEKKERREEGREVKRIGRREEERGEGMERKEREQGKEWEKAKGLMLLQVGETLPATSVVP